MKATSIEFRLRMVIMVALVFLGFYAPWIELLHMDTRKPLLEWIPLELSRMGVAGFAPASTAVIVVGSLVALLGAVFRIWGAAYLGYRTVHHGQMQAAAVMADGPYRYVRNPLYIGGWCMMLAMALLMPPSGALVSMALLTLFLLRLIFGEEAYLGDQLGEPYRAYLRTVPRLMPRLRGAPPAAGNTPRWSIAFLSELNPIGIFFSLAVLSWRYDYILMLKGVLVSFGLSLVVRALIPRRHGESDVA